MRTYEFKVSFQDALTPKVLAFAATLQDRTQLHRSMGAELQQEIHLYVRDSVPGFHRTAESLGGTPTGFVEDAADSVAGKQTKTGPACFLGFTNAGGYFALNHPWFARALGPVHLVPKAGHKFLAIPARSEYYGHRAAEYADLRFAVLPHGGPVLIEGKKLVWGRKDKKGNRQASLSSEGEGLVAYWLKTFVDQGQDRDRLPSEETMTQALRRGGVRYLRVQEKQSRGGSP